MGANATGVSACVQRIPSSSSHPKAFLRRLRRRLISLPTLASLAVLLTLGGLIAPLLWIDRESHRRDSLADATSRLELIANLASLEMARLAGRDRLHAAHLASLARTLPQGSLGAGRQLVLADKHGGLVGVEPASARALRNLSDLFQDAQPMPFAANAAGAVAVTLADGAKAIATVRSFPSGHVAVIQPLAALREAGYTPGRADAALAFAVALGLGGLGLGWSWQARRLQLTRRASRRVRERVDASLARGRCGLWDWDLARGHILWSASLYGLLGYEQRDQPLSFSEFNAIIDLEGGDLYGLARQAAGSPGRPLDHVVRARTAAGGRLWLRLKAEVTEDPADGARHLIGIAVDVTDEVEALAQKAAADLRLRDGIEAISEAFVLWDENNRLVLCNSRFQKLHDLPDALVQPGISYGQISAAGRPPRMERRRTCDLAGTGEGRSLEAQLSDGRWLQINERRTREGGFVSVSTDITDIKRHAEKLLASERRLLELVRKAQQSRHAAQLQAQQFADLAERYHEQRDEAESANRAKTEFLAKMSHELRTPLNAILGFAELMQHQIMGPLGCDKYREYVGHIHGSGMGLLEKIDDIMRLSKIETGQFSIAPQPLDLREVVAEAVAGTSREADSKRVQLLCDVVDTPTLSADPAALRQVLTQLLRNGVKFTRAGGKVRVRVRRADRAINLFVEDDGIGIPQAFMCRLGAPFEQVETEYQRSEKGCGVGLPLARALTEMHGGRLRIRSQEGVGTVVLVHLPLTSALAEDFPELELPYLQAAE